MFKYKNNYIFKYERDSNLQIYNRDDNYLACRNRGKIYRYSSDILVFESPSKIRIKSVDNTTGEVFYDYTDLIIEVIDTDAERLITFKEENFDKLRKLFKVRKRRKVELTDEQKEGLRTRLINARNKKISSSNIPNDELEDDINDYEDEL